MIPERLQGAPTIALSSLLFAAMATLARSTAGRLPVGQLAFVRMLIGLVVMIGVFVVLRRGPHIRRPRLLAARGFLGGLAVALYFVAIEQLEVGPATLLNNTAPAYAALLAALFLRERIRAHVIAGIVVATLGAGLVVWSTLAPGAGLNLGRTLGVAAGLISAVLSAGAMTTMRALRQDTDTLTVLFSFVLIGAIVTMPPAVIGQGMPPLSMFPHAFGVGILSIGAQLLLTHAFKYVSASAGSATTQLTTVFSWTMGVLLLGEPARPLALGGALVCITGVIIASGIGTAWLAARDTA